MRRDGFGLDSRCCGKLAPCLETFVYDEVGEEHDEHQGDPQVTGLNKPRVRHENGESDGEWATESVRAEVLLLEEPSTMVAHIENDDTCGDADNEPVVEPQGNPCADESNHEGLKSSG